MILGIVLLVAVVFAILHVVDPMEHGPGGF